MAAHKILANLLETQGERNTNVNTTQLPFDQVICKQTFAQPPQLDIERRPELKGVFNNHFRYSIFYESPSQHVIVRLS